MGREILFGCLCMWVSAFTGIEHWWLTNQAVQQCGLACQKQGVNPNRIRLREDLIVSAGNFSHFFGSFVRPIGFPPLCDRTIEQIQRHFERAIYEMSVGVVDKVNLVRQREWTILSALRNNGSDFVRPFLDGQISKELEQDYCRASRNERPYLDLPRRAQSWDEDVILRPSPYVEYARANYDHFQANGCAQRTYTKLHNLAWRYARSRRPNHAMAAEAAALHFLADVFSSGNIRTQRALIQAQCGSEAGTGLSACQHDEDNAIGLNVQNAQGETWTTFGDHFFFTNGNKRNSELALAAAKKSIPEIFEKRLANAALLLIPSSIHDANFAPMFLPKSNSVFIREPFGPGVKMPKKEVKYIERLGPANCDFLLTRCDVRGRYEAEAREIQSHFQHLALSIAAGLAGLVLVFYGLRLFQAALFFVAFLLCFAGAFLICHALQQENALFEGIFAIGLGIFGGIAVLLTKKAGIFLLCLWLGLALASLVDTGLCRNFFNPKLASALSLSVFGLVVCFVTMFVEDLVVVASTSFLGAYVFVRALSLYCGHWPTTEWWIANHSTEDVPWQWYLWVLAILALAMWGVAAQLGGERRDYSPRSRSDRLFAG